MRQAYTEIQEVVTALENPGSNERIDELNQQIQDYLENVREPLNLSFWQSVNYHYWSFNNLSKLLGSKFDVELGYELRKFEEKVKMVQKLRINQSSPRFPVRHQPVPNISDVPKSPGKPVDPEKDNMGEKSPKEFTNSYYLPTVIGCTCLAIFVAWFSWRSWRFTNSQ